MLHGRAGEMAAVDQLLAGTSSGQGGALVLRGEPGIGKSALLGYAQERADSLRVLRTVGAAAESRLPYAALHQLLHPLLGHLDRLPALQPRALSVAFGLEAGETPDRFLVSVAALTLLSEAAEERPLLLLVDDAH